MAEQRFTTLRTRSLTFSGDGSRFAVLAEPRKGIDEPVREELLCIHDTTTGRLLGALPSTSGHLRLYLDHDGRRAVTVRDDDTLEMWDLSELAKY